MFIRDHHGEMINISDFESISVAYRTFLGSDPAHVIIGKYAFNENKPFQRGEKIIGIFTYRKHAEMVYEDLIKTTSEGSEPFAMPSGDDIHKGLSDETINEFVGYEKQWLKEGGVKAQPARCLGMLVILFSVVALILALIGASIT